MFSTIYPEEIRCSSEKELKLRRRNWVSTRIMGFRQKNNSKIVRQHPDFPRRWLRLSEATDDFIHAGVGSAKAVIIPLKGGTHYIQKPTGKIPWNEYWLRFKTARRKTYTIQYNSRVLFGGWRQWMSLIF